MVTPDTDNIAHKGVNMSDAHTYTTKLEWKETRKGVISAEGLPTLEVATPPEFPGGIEGFWSPEHLFVAAAEVCLMTTFLAIAENSKLEFVSYSSEAVGTLEKTDEGFRITKIVIRPHVVIEDDGLADRARRIVEKAEHHCLVSNSMKTQIELDVTVSVS
jgi:peroxiredoxin-like protein